MPNGSVLHISGVVKYFHLLKPTLLCNRYDPKYLQSTITWKFVWFVTTAKISIYYSYHSFYNLLHLNTKTFMATVLILIETSGLETCHVEWKFLRFAHNYKELLQKGRKSTVTQYLNDTIGDILSESFFVIYCLRLSFFVLSILLPTATIIISNIILADQNRPAFAHQTNIVCKFIELIMLYRERAIIYLTALNKWQIQRNNVDFNIYLKKKFSTFYVCDMEFFVAAALATKYRSQPILDRLLVSNISKFRRDASYYYQFLHISLLRELLECYFRGKLMFTVFYYKIV